MNNYRAIFLVPVLILSSFMTSCQSEEEPVAPVRSIPVRLAKVDRAELSQTIHTYGRLSTKKEIKLSFKIHGIIKNLLAEEGQTVRQGQLLARLDLSEINSQVNQARSTLEKVRRDLERVENLYKEKAATLEQFQNVQTAYQVIESQLETAEFNKVHSEIYAPSDGRILKRLMEENEIVGAGMPIFIFGSTDADWIFRVGVSDRNLVRVKLGDPAVIKFDAYPGVDFSAEVSEIVMAADPMTGTFELELKIAETPLRFVSGFVGEVEIYPSTKRMYSIIPVESLVLAHDNQKYVYAVDHKTNKARRLSVTVGYLFQDKAAILSGLENIEEVVYDGAAYLTDGYDVTVIREAESPDNDINP